MILRQTRSRRALRLARESVGSSCASTAILSCEIDSDGFERPPRLAGAVEKQETQHRDGEMPLDGVMQPRLEMCEADFLLRVLEEPLDVPA